MRAPASGPSLRVAIDARLVPSEWGGVEAVVIGLASGLSGLSDEPADYAFVAWKGHTSWLRPHVSGPARIVEAPLPPWLDADARPPLRQRIGERMPAVRAIWRRRPWRVVEPGPPRSDPFVERMRPDVVHLPMQSGFLTRTPTIFHPHDLQHVHLPEFFSDEVRAHREIWYGTLSRQAAMVAVASRWTKQDVERHFGLPEAKVHIVPLAPPIDAYPEPTAEGTAETSRRLRLPDAYVLYPAQTWPHKNHVGLLQALHRLRQERGLVVPLVAPGHQNEHFAELERLTAELGLMDQVRWLGFVSGDDLRVLYRRARAVVIPTLFEAGSAPLWEAFREGVPAACSNVTSLPAQAGDAALVFDPHDVGQIGEATARLWIDEALRETLAVRGRERIAGLSWERTARTFRAHYRRLAGRPPSDEDRALIDAESPF
jgi:glycosyltransferase involved in cell wall biosynthesis